jgi:hypothetical protein
VTLRWVTITGPLAWCSRCGWAQPCDGDRSNRRAIAAARRHADATGHSVIVERGQTLSIAPAEGDAQE